MTISQMTVADVDECTRVLLRAYAAAVPPWTVESARDHLHEMTHTPAFFGLTAREDTDKEVCGFVAGCRETIHQECHYIIKQLCIDPSASAGVIEQLLREAISHLKNAQVGQVHVFVARGSPSQEAFAAFGFAPNERLVVFSRKI